MTTHLPAAQCGGEVCDSCRIWMRDQAGTRNRRCRLISPMRTAIAVCALGFLATPLAAQTAAPTARTAIYGELLGNGGLFSVNLDHRIGRSTGIRIGFASWTAQDWWSDEQTRMITLPAQAYLLTSPAGAHHLELGGGVMVGHKHSAVGSGGFASLTATIGYRYQRPSGGFVFRAGFTPFYGLNGSSDRAYPDKGFMPMIGLSFGGAF